MYYVNKGIEHLYAISFFSSVASAGHVLTVCVTCLSVGKPAKCRSVLTPLSKPLMICSRGISHLLRITCCTVAWFMLKSGKCPGL